MRLALMFPGSRRTAVADLCRQLVVSEATLVLLQEELRTWACVSCDGCDVAPGQKRRLNQLVADLGAHSDYACFDRAYFDRFRNHGCRSTPARMFVPELPKLLMPAPP